MARAAIWETPPPMSAAFVAVETSGLERVYRTGRQSVYALRGVDLTVAAGHFVALKGRSGSGKTTLLNCIGGLDEPTGGDVRVFGRSLAGLSDGDLTDWRRRHVGFIFQSFGLLPALSAYENVELLLRIGGVPRRDRPRQALRSLEMVGLAKWRDHRPYELSGGQQQRVAIARAIATRPLLLLADEATGELDTETTHDVLSLFRTIVRDEGLTLLLATHDPLADAYADRILHLQDGQLLPE
jgi:ABC-type lipoprotein export system ATPase subunit